MLDSTLKRKFSLNLHSSKQHPQRTEIRAFRAVTPVSTLNMVVRDKYASEFSPPPSPVICRRPLSPKVEAQLRTACLALAHINEVSLDQPKLDFELLHQAMKEKKSEDKPAAHSRHRRERSDDPFLSNPHSITSTVPPKRSAFQPDTAFDHLFPQASGSHANVQANIGRPRDADHSKAHRRQDSAEKNSMSNSGRSNSSTPLTAGSSERHHHVLSTAPTSVTALSPEEVASKRQSRHALEEAARIRSDAAAAAWMREEAEKRRKQSMDAEAPFHGGLSRKRSIREGIKEYIRPGSSHMSRKTSTDSLRKDSMQSQNRASTSHGWRSWSLQRKSSKSSLSSRPGSSTGPEPAPPLQPSRPAINLNRELPPLPSLDSWQDNQAEKPASTTTHIANLIRSGSRHRSKKEPRSSHRGEPSGRPRISHDIPEPARPVKHLPSNDEERKRIHRRSRSVPDVLQTKPASKEPSQQPLSDPRPEEKSQPGTPAVLKENNPPTASNNGKPQRKPSYRIPSLHFDSLPVGNASQAPSIRQPQSADTLVDHSAPSDTLAHSECAIAVAPVNVTTMRISIDNTRRLVAPVNNRGPSFDGETPNFSRKISVDQARREPYESPNATMVHITAGLQDTKPDKKGFKKFLGVLGSLGRKKSSNSMENRTSANESAGAPVVKY